MVLHTGLAGSVVVLLLLLLLLSLLVISNLQVPEVALVVGQTFHLPRLPILLLLLLHAAPESQEAGECVHLACAAVVALLRLLNTVSLEVQLARAATSAGAAEAATETFTPLLHAIEQRLLLLGLVSLSETDLSDTAQISASGRSRRS